MTPTEKRPLSLCVITQDEERNIQACLESASFCDDIIVVDSGSSDRTRELASAAGARVVEEPFRGHVKQKAYAVSLARHDWVLCLDADERVCSTMRQAIEQLSLEGSERAGYWVTRRNFYLGAWIRFGGWASERRIRLFDRNHGHWTGMDPHDRVEVKGETSVLPGFLDHYNYRDMAHHLEKVNSYTSIMATRRFESGVRFRWSSLLFRPPMRFLKMYVLKRGFLDGWRGLILASIGAFYVFLKYAKLWELERVRPR